MSRFHETARSSICFIMYPQNCISVLDKCIVDSLFAGMCPNTCLLYIAVMALYAAPAFIISMHASICAVCVCASVHVSVMCVCVCVHVDACLHMYTYLGSQRDSGWSVPPTTPRMRHSHRGNPVFQQWTQQTFPAPQLGSRSANPTDLHKENY